MHWVLQSNIFKEDGHDAIIRTLQRFDIPFSEHKVVPFIGQIEPDISPTGKVVCMGSYALRHLAKEKGWSPGVWDLEGQNFIVQRIHWADHMLNYFSLVTEFENVRITEDSFIRPIEDTKVFAGRIFSREEFVEWQHIICDLNEHPNGTTITNDTLVVVAPLRKIYSEYRFWVVKGEIVTSSRYKLGDKVGYVNGAPEDMTTFARKRIAEWEPHEAFVIDTADTSEGFKIVEINTLNSSGYYAGDMQKLVMSIQEAFG